MVMTARLVYRRNMDSSSGLLEKNQSIKTEKEELTGEAGLSSIKLFSEQSRTLRKAIQQLKPMQVSTLKTRTYTLSFIPFIYGGMTYVAVWNDLHVGLVCATRGFHSLWISVSMGEMNLIFYLSDKN